MVIRPQPKVSPAKLSVPPAPPRAPAKEVKGETALDAPSAPLPLDMGSSALAVVAIHPEVMLPEKPPIRIVPGQDHLAIYAAEKILEKTGIYYAVSSQIGRLVPVDGTFKLEVINPQTLYVLLSEMIDWQSKISLGNGRAATRLSAS